MDVFMFYCIDFLEFMKCIHWRKHKGVMTTQGNVTKQIKHVIRKKLGCSSFRVRVACLMLSYVVSILSTKGLSVSWYVMFLLISQNIETKKVWILWLVVSINSYPQKTLKFCEKYHYGFEVLNVKISCKMWVRRDIIMKLAS
jgi:hypothetical protein